jgi:hypothetical protein
MSTLKSINVIHPSGSTTNIVNDSSGNVTVGNDLTVTGALVPSSSFKRNRIINGNMLIDQRGSATTPVTTSGYNVDRWYYENSVASKMSVGQNSGSITPPAGFTKYLGAVTTSAYSITSTDYFDVSHAIEGLNIADLAWGTANAKTVTLSFWAYSSLTGTFGGALRNGGINYSYPFSYAISSANTWTYVTVTIVGPTAGTWASDNTMGLRVIFSLGVGSTYSGAAGAWSATNYLSVTGAVSVVGTGSATFYLTGVQLEVGTKATPYEMQIYSDQLAQCQRYYVKDICVTAAAPTSTSAMTVSSIFFPVALRTTPSLSASNITGLSFSGYTVFDTPITYSSTSSATTQAIAFNTNNPNARTAAGVMNVTYAISVEL